MKTAAIFGAGNVGRGFIAQVFSDAGLRVVFVDLAEPLIAALQSDGCYSHFTVDNDSRTEIRISPVSAISAADPAAVAELLDQAVVAATCVGARALPAVCAAIAPGLAARIRAGRPPLNLLLAENLHDAAPKVRGWLQDAEPALTDGVLDAGVGLVATSIGRMIPAPRTELAATSPSAIEVEPYRFLPIDLHAVIGDLPELPGVVADRDVPFAYYGDRKLYLHNMGHAICAYLGRLAGDEFIWQAVGRPELRSLVREAMVESASALAAAYQRPIGDLLDHVDDLLHRFGNRALADTVARVGADPARKLAAGDRLLGAYQLCLDQGVRPSRISLGIAAGLRQLAETGMDATTIDDYLDQQGLTPAPTARALLAQQYRDLADGFDPARQAALIEHQFRKSEIA